jgi:hypothetical protein
MSAKVVRARYTITVDDAELDIVRRALAREVVAKPIKVATLARTTRPFTRAFYEGEREWAAQVQRVVDQPGLWRSLLIGRFTRRLSPGYIGYNSIEEVERAWGIAP